MCKRIFKRFDIDIAASGAASSKTFELDKTITRIHGLLFLSDRNDLMYYRGTQKVEINRQEIFPEGYATQLLMSGINVSPNDRYYRFEGGIEPGNGKVVVEYQDNPTTVIAFAAYRVSLYLELEVAETS